MKKSTPKTTCKPPDRPLSYAEWVKQSKPKFHWKVDVLCDRLQTVANAGLIIRTAAGLGIRSVFFLRPKFNLNTKKLNKLSRSNSRHVELKRIEKISDIDFSKYDYIVGLEYSQNSTSIYQHRLSGPTLLILGSEFNGIQLELLNLANEVYHIPLSGEQSSINVAQAFSGAMVHINAKRIKMT